MSQDYEEKRSFARIQVETTVQFREIGSDVVYEGVSRDLSATGLLIQTRHALSVGTALHLEIHTDNARLPPFIATGKVLRVTPVPSVTKDYLISIALSDTQ